MKAALLVAPQQYEFRDVPTPQVPAGGVLLRVKACGICGSDLRRWREGPPPGSAGVITGHEISGEVAAVGAGHTTYNVGERLALAPDIHCGECYYCQHGRYNLCDNMGMLGIMPEYPGGFAEYIALPPFVLTNGIVHRVPEGLSDDFASLGEPCSSVLACHQRLGTRFSDTVVILGAGPIGCLHVAVAKANGAVTILSEPSPIRRRMAEPFAPDAILDPSAEDIVARVKQLTRGLGADIAICANPIAATQTQAVELVRKGGKVVLFGGLPKANPLTMLDGNRIHYGEIEVLGSFSYHPTFHALALEAIRRGIIPAEKVITHTMPLAEVNRGFETAAGGEALKVVLRP